MDVQQLQRGPVSLAIGLPATVIIGLISGSDGWDVDGWRYVDDDTQGAVLSIADWATTIPSALEWLRLSYSWNVAIAAISGAGDDRPGSVGFKIKISSFTVIFIVSITMLNDIDRSCRTLRVNKAHS